MKPVHPAHLKDGTTRNWQRLPEAHCLRLPHLYLEGLDALRGIRCSRGEPKGSRIGSSLEPLHPRVQRHQNSRVRVWVLGKSWELEPRATKGNIKNNKHNKRNENTPQRQNRSEARRKAPTCDHQDSSRRRLCCTNAIYHCHDVVTAVACDDGLPSITVELARHRVRELRLL